MFTTDQSASMERNGPQDRAAFVIGRPWVGSASQNVFTPRRFPERGTFVLWLSDPGLPAPIDVHGVALVGNLHFALWVALRWGYTLALEPVAVTVGTCAVIQDESGVRLCLLEPTSPTQRLT